MNSKKKLKLTDIYRLPFDSEDSGKLSAEDFKEMQKQSKMLEDYINSQAAQPTDSNKV